MLLVVEDEASFAEILVELGRERGFKVLLAGTGEDALGIARAVRPDAITLDLMLPDMDGWVLLDRLKHDPSTRHIPVHIISAVADERRGLEAGAIAVLAKPVLQEDVTGALDRIHSFLRRRVKRLLVVEDDPVHQDAIVTLVGQVDLDITTAGTAAEALTALITDEPFDCMVTDLVLPDRTGLDLIREVRNTPSLRTLPIIVYTGMELTREQTTALERLAETVIVKDVRSPERLVEETALFLHRVETALPDESQRMLARLGAVHPALDGKRVLVVDDDVRNVFALTAVLEHHGMVVEFSENGREALDRLEKIPAEPIDIVLMDIMMPEMDGWETTRRLRTDPRLATLPVIALTAKAMKGDRERCLEAGASDYVTKPVDTDQLLSLLRVWLSR
ncbi:MAG: response regulator [Myxococcota bacterium]